MTVSRALMASGQLMDPITGKEISFCSLRKKHNHIAKNTYWCSVLGWHRTKHMKLRMLCKISVTRYPGHNNRPLYLGCQTNVCPFEEYTQNYQCGSGRKKGRGDYTKAFDCVDHNKLWKTLKDVGIPDYLICFLRKLYAGQEATVRTKYRTVDWFKIVKKYVKDV